MFRIGQIIYRAMPPDDGGDWTAQHLKVLSVKGDSITVCIAYGDGDPETISGDALSTLYTNKLECCKECWRQDGKPDAFEQLCARKGLRTKEAKVKELAEQMDMWGARDYDDLLNCLI